jgi:hypothetical protein
LPMVENEVLSISVLESLPKKKHSAFTFSKSVLSRGFLLFGKHS